MATGPRAASTARATCPWLLQEGASGGAALEPLDGPFWKPSSPSPVAPAPPPAEPGREASSLTQRGEAPERAGALGRRWRREVIELRLLLVLRTESRVLRLAPAQGRRRDLLEGGEAAHPAGVRQRACAADVRGRKSTHPPCKDTFIDSRRCHYTYRIT